MHYAQSGEELHPTASLSLPVIPTWLVCPVCGDLVPNGEEQCMYCGGCGPFAPPTDGIMWRIQTVPESGRPPRGRSWLQQVSLESRLQVMAPGITFTGSSIARMTFTSSRCMTTRAI